MPATRMRMLTSSACPYQAGSPCTACTEAEGELVVLAKAKILLGCACKATLILCTQFCSRFLDFSPSLSFSLTLFLPFIASSFICHKIHHYIFAVFCLFIFGLHLEVEWLGHIVISFTYFKGIDKLFFIKDVPLPFLSEIFEKLISHILANVFLLFK